MITQQTIWFLVLGIALLAGWVDFRTRKIPNWVTVPSFLLGIGLHVAASGWLGAKTSLEGAGLALGLLLPFVLLRGLGAGDWKLMGAVGAFLGPLMFLFVLFGSLVISGLMAVVAIYRTRKVGETLRNVWILVRGFFSFGLRANPKISLDNPALLKVPFGVAVAISTLGCFCAARWML